LHPTSSIVNMLTNETKTIKFIIIEHWAWFGCIIFYLIYGHILSILSPKTLEENRIAFAGSERKQGVERETFVPDYR
jgi:hypothetical protein